MAEKKNAVAVDPIHGKDMRPFLSSSGIQRQIDALQKANPDRCFYGPAALLEMAGKIEDTRAVS